MIEVKEIQQTQSSSFNVLSEFLLSNGDQESFTENPNDSSLKKLEKLNDVQINDLIEDVADEILKRNGEKAIKTDETIIPKRKQAKEKIAMLDRSRLVELVQNLSIDISKRQKSENVSLNLNRNPPPANVVGGKMMHLSTDCINSILNDLDIHCEEELEKQKESTNQKITELNSKITEYESQITAKDNKLSESKEEIVFLSTELKDSQLSNSIMNLALEECKTKIDGINESKKLKRELDDTIKKMSQLEYHLRQIPIRYSASQIGNFNAMFLLAKSRFDRVNKENPLAPQVKVMIDTIKEILLASEQLVNSLEILLDPLHPSLERVHTILPICHIIMSLISSYALGIKNTNSSTDSNNKNSSSSLDLSNLLDNTSILVESCESLLEEIVITE